MAGPVDSGHSAASLFNSQLSLFEYPGNGIGQNEGFGILLDKVKCCVFFFCIFFFNSEILFDLMFRPVYEQKHQPPHIADKSSFYYMPISVGWS